MKFRTDTFPVLLRHFLRDAFMNEEDGLGRRGIGSVTLVIAGLMILGTLLTMDVLVKYLLLGQAQFATPFQIQVEKLRFFSLQATISGIIICAGVRTFMPRLRDFELVRSLPVRGRTLVGAKVSAAATFVLLVSTAYSLPAAVTFTLFTSDTAWVNPLRMLLTLIIGSTLQTLGILCIVMMLQGPLTFAERIPGGKVFAGLVRGGVLLFFIGVFCWFPGVYEKLLTAGSDPGIHLSWWPPAWLAGFPLPAGSPLLPALLVVFPAVAYGLFLLIGLTSFQKNGIPSERSVHVRKHRGIISHPVAWSGFLALVIFFRLTLKRSRRLKAIILFITAATLSLALIPMAARWLDSGEAAQFSDLLTLLPLMLNISLVCALRFCVIQAVEPESSWVFRLLRTSAGHPRPALLTAFVLNLVVPLNTVLFGLLAFPLGPVAAGKLVIFHAATGMALAAALLINFPWMPFSIRGLADEEGVKLDAVRWLLVIVFYYWIMRALGKVDLGGGTAWILVGAAPICAVIILVVILFIRGRKKVLLFEVDA